MNIESGIPIPPQTNGRPLSMAGDLARRMKVGESVLCQSKREWETVRRTIRDLGGKCTSRRMTTGWRVWRVE